jgi:hypothetical protein
MRTVLMLTAGLLGAMVLGVPAHAAVAADCAETLVRELPCEASLPPCTEPAATLEPCQS